MSESYKYDVCLSFAGEQRSFVGEVAEELRRLDVNVFYDKFESVELWGKDLYQHLDYVYREASQYCVVFVSKEYAAKAWTQHEHRSAMARALESHSECILPARFDDTAIPGLRPTISYVDLRETTPLELAQITVSKIRASTLSDRTAYEPSATSPHERVKIQFSSEQARKLDELVATINYGKTDAVRRAVEIFAAIDQAMSPDGKLFVRRSENGEMEQIVIV